VKPAALLLTPEDGPVGILKYPGTVGLPAIFCRCNSSLPDIRGLCNSPCCEAGRLIVTQSNSYRPLRGLFCLSNTGLVAIF
jgi:hypothetical protein